MTISLRRAAALAALAAAAALAVAIGGSVGYELIEGVALSMGYD